MAADLSSQNYLNPTTSSMPGLSSVTGGALPHRSEMNIPSSVGMNNEDPQVTAADTKSMDFCLGFFV